MSSAAPTVMNAAGYRFVPVDGLGELRQALDRGGRDCGVVGTILLAPEGINFFLSGAPSAVERFLGILEAADGRLAGLDYKVSWSEAPAFRRFKVRLKKEIITMRQPGMRPAQGRAPAVEATTLRQWLDQGHDDQNRPLVLLDTRNDYEVLEGTFEGARTLGLRRFADFPAVADAALAQEPGLRSATVVTFCTGGIRCEKAALYLRQRGFSHAVQLQGGILKYFEEAGGAHFRGRCFVFDERQALDASLTPQSPAPSTSPTCPLTQP